MEFPDVLVAGLGGPEITRWDADAIRRLKKDGLDSLEKILGEFGKRSAVAQGLSGPITDIYRLRGSDQTLYLQAARGRGGTTIYGGIKVGKKKLFVRRSDCSLVEMEPLCVLDFYVHESCQRKGVGKALFEHMLVQESIDPGSLAYDRPSPKLIAFLRRHYGLKDYVPQGNNYVVFDEYFHLNPDVSKRSSRLDSWGRQGNMLPAGRSSFRSASPGRMEISAPSVVPPWGLTTPPATASTSSPGVPGSLQQRTGSGNCLSHSGGSGACSAHTAGLPPAGPSSSAYTSPGQSAAAGYGTSRSQWGGGGHPFQAPGQITTPTHTPGRPPFPPSSPSGPMRSLSLDRAPNGQHPVDSLDSFRRDYSTRPPSGPGSTPKAQLLPPWGSDLNPPSQSNSKPVHTTPPWGIDPSAWPSTYRQDEHPQIGRRISSPATPIHQSPYATDPAGYNSRPGPDSRLPNRGSAPVHVAPDAQAATPKQAAMKQRSGSGAAGCMVW